MRRTKAESIVRLYSALEKLGFSSEETSQLIRIERQLSRWSERECGDSNDYASFAIERDEDGKPFEVRHIHPRHGMPSQTIRTPIRDTEASALRRLKLIMNNHTDAIAYHQGDPRGCALWIVSKADLGDLDINSCYTRGVAVYVD
jgi:hypothetical protein